MFRLHTLAELRDVDFRLNPVVKNESDYRLFVVHMLPKLRQLGRLASLAWAGQWAGQVVAPPSLLAAWVGWAFAPFLVLAAWTGGGCLPHLPPTGWVLVGVCAPRWITTLIFLKSNDDFLL